MKITEKAWNLQHHIENKHRQRKNLKEQRYRKWLKKPTRPLPTYKTLALWRKILFLAGFLLYIPIPFQLMFFYHTCFYGPYSLITWILPIVGFFLWGFATTFDWVIHRRWQGEKTTLIDWSLQDRNEET